MNKEIYFKSGENRLFGRLYVPDTYDRGVVFLHGGGASTSIRYAYLQSECYKNNIVSFAFDFRGCGKSEGVFSEGSLLNRIIDTTNAVSYFLEETKLDNSHFYLWGASMGAHVACKLLNTISPYGVILQCAAAYGKEAESVPLDEEFTKIIRAPHSWENSLAFEMLTEYKGRKLIIYGEKDETIPDEVKARYRDCHVLQIGGLAMTSYVELKGGGHRLLSPQNEEERKALVELARTGIEFILKDKILR